MGVCPGLLEGDLHYINIILGDPGKLNLMCKCYKQVFSPPGKSPNGLKERNVVEVGEVVALDEAGVAVDGEAVIEEALTDLETDNLTDEVEVTKRKCKLSLSLPNYILSELDKSFCKWVYVVTLVGIMVLAGLAI
jgi:hypothetical protein